MRGRLNVTTLRSAAALAAAVILASCGASSNLRSLLPAHSRSALTHGPDSIAADWSTFGGGPERWGYNASESIINTGSFGTMHALWAKPAQVGFHMQGEPVIASGVLVNGVARDLLYAGAGHGVFYALDADTGTTVWKKQLGSITYSCATHTNNWGIEGTAAIDRAHNRVYVPDGANQVHALDLSTGAEASGWPLSIAPPNDLDFIHNGLNYNANNGLLYVGTSGVCDTAPWYGRVTAIDTNAGTILNTFYTVPGGEGGGVWGFGGAAIDPTTNNVYIATGNAVGMPQFAGYAEHIVELSADLSTVIAQNHPAGMPPMGDADFGTTPLLFQPVGCPPRLAAVNKSGALLLYDMSTIASGPVQMIDMSRAHEASFRQVPAYDPVTNYVYVVLPSTYGIYQPGLGAFSIAADCTLNPTPVWNAVFGPDGATTSAEATRSAVTIANGVVYVSGYTDRMTYAFDAATGNELWSAPLKGIGIVGPVVWNGHLYVGDMSGEIQAWTP